MKFSFEVGQYEKHQIEFQWSKWQGVAKIWVDGALIQKRRPLAYSELAQLAAMRGIGGKLVSLVRPLVGKSRSR
jgi:hypothetical protein